MKHHAYSYPLTFLLRSRHPRIARAGDGKGWDDPSIDWHTRMAYRTHAHWVPTFTANVNTSSLASPFLLVYKGADSVQSKNVPLMDLTSSTHFATMYSNNCEVLHYLFQDDLVETC